MGESYDKLREQYADSIWLRSETTYIRGPLRDSFDPPFERSPFLAPEPARFELTFTTMSGRHHSVKTIGEVTWAVFDTGETLLIFRAVFGEALADFALVTSSLLNRAEQKELAGKRTALNP